MNWKRTLWILWSANFIAVVGTSMIIPFLPLYIENLGVHDLTQVERWSGAIFSSQMLMAVIFQPLWGTLADKYGRKPMLLRAGIGMGIMTVLMGFVTAPWQLLMLRLINGVFSGFISMSISLQASVTPDEHSGKALGTLQTGQMAGTLIGPLIGGFLSELLGFRAVFISTGALLLAASIVVMFFVKEDVSAKKAVKKTNKETAGWRVFAPLIPVFIATTVTQIAMMSIQPILTIYTKTIYHGSHIAFIAGLVIAASGIANLIGSPFLGRFGDKIGQRKILILSLIMAALSFLPQALTHRVWILIIGRFMLGLFVGGMLPSLNVLVKKLAPKSVQAKAFGFNSSAQFLGNFVGPLLGSSIAASFNIRVVFYVTMSILLANAIVIFLNRKLDEPKRHDTMNQSA
ncbi:DHA1 family multidrug resistance protein-like MFS transporter [Scopulibacillus daqui]|uniref:DHA1 family multidrug resistance protein-like MFS transporter n=1 Tax=Scopulibacillus daqui TaxID=1469162 RepID=A0ABS2Q3V5_9BACL|nr:MFS transporter [Scopulibacillus daqui]MBM7646981.1 DHA1 family multidrug resistance protein-like MFS transporter [Scopulibacillus daqui]